MPSADPAQEHDLQLVLLFAAATEPQESCSSNSISYKHFKLNPTSRSFVKIFFFSLAVGFLNFTIEPNICYS